MEPHSSILQDVPKTACLSPLGTMPPLPRLLTTCTRRAHRPHDQSLSRSHLQRAMRRGDFLLSCRRFLSLPFCCTTEPLSSCFVRFDADVSPATPLSCFSRNDPLSSSLPISLSRQLVKMQTTHSRAATTGLSVEPTSQPSVFFPKTPDGRKDRDSGVEVTESSTNK